MARTGLREEHQTDENRGKKKGGVVERTTGTGYKIPNRKKNMSMVWKKATEKGGDRV